jgi:pimeloyl-ACP methyl ester carboxylesterase
MRSRGYSLRAGICAGLALAAGGLISSAALSQDSGGDIPLDIYARAGTLVSAPGGRKLNIRCVGAGSPVVVLTAGGGDQSLTWRSLQSRLAEGGTVCAWDRAGFGFSDPSPFPQDVDHRTDDLERVLSGAGLKPPFILVGHSLGSFETLMYAFRHRARVAGIVLIDPSAPDQDVRLKRAAPFFYKLIDGFQQGAMAGLQACIDGAAERGRVSNPDCVTVLPKEYPIELREVMQQRDAQTAAKRSQLSLFQSMFSGVDSRQLRAAWRNLGDIPVTVLSAGLPPPIPLEGKAKEDVPLMQAEWWKMHDEIVQISSRGTRRTVSDASHYIYLDQPGIVLDAISSMRAGVAGAAPRVVRPKGKTRPQRRDR